jgi:two-component system sensor histidine kinase KdpD
MTRLEAGAIRPRLEAIDIGEVVGVALGRAQPLLSRHKPEVDLPEDLPMVKADFVLLEQVFFNLLDNAAKYTPQDSGIRIAGYSSGESVTLEVIDEGAGIPSRSADAIFEKFTRLEAGDRTRAGTGLGLAICRGFVEAMGGSVTAGNRQDRSGAVFTITLMAADSVGAPQEVAHVG